MRRSERVGRNDACPCGSGKKFKRCCEATVEKGGLGSRVVMVAVVSTVIAAMLLVFFAFNSQSNGPAPLRQVWSPEHGHYHDVP